MMLDPEWMRWTQTRALVRAFSAHPGALRFVGGAVRDAVLGRAVTEVDAATTLLPQEVMALLDNAGIRVIPTGMAHGTVTAVIVGKSFEITTLRHDVATDGRHAQVAFTDDWQADASRRDFTMNALYLAPDGELFDYFGGAEDARAGRVRFIGDASRRISEDYLRILRFFRFHAYYGHGQPDAQALIACAAQGPMIATLSGERIQQELSKLLLAPHVAESVQLMHAHGLLPYMLGFAVSGTLPFPCFAEIEALEGFPVPVPVRLGGFIIKALIPQEEAMATLARRLRLSNQSERMLQSVLQGYQRIFLSLSIAGQKRLIRKLGSEDFTGAVVLRWAEGNETIGRQHPYHAMLHLAAHWQPPKFPISGGDLIALGFSPGKGMGELLQQMEEQWEASDYRLTKEELLKQLDEG